MEKTCTICSTTKTTEDFHVNRRSKDGLQVRCKSCYQDWHKDYYNRPGMKAATRNRDLQRLCGIDIELFEFVLQEQGGVCRICKGPKSDKTGWHADHDHTTNKFRGVLCGNCNRGLGQFKDNAATLISAATYLSL